GLPALGVVLAMRGVRLLPGEYFAGHARTAQRDNLPDAAVGFALRGLKTEQRDPYLYQYLASAKLTHCDSISDLQEQPSCYEDALPALEKARALAPQDRNFLVPLALTYDGVARFAEAE